jgi:hypothetical protein
MIINAFEIAAADMIMIIGNYFFLDASAVLEEEAIDLR